MKLKNKKTGEIRPAVAREDGIYLYDETTEQWYKIELSLLAEGWEYYEEPKVGYIIDPMEEDCVSADDSGYEESDVERAKELGIWFETKEEARRAVEKLKTWHKLMEYWGTEVVDWEVSGLPGLPPSPLQRWQAVNVKLNVRVDKKEPMELLNILFGGEE